MKETPPIEFYGAVNPGRNLYKYLDQLKLDEEFLMGKKVLDIGSGFSSFVDDLKQDKIDVMVTSIDPLYAHKQVVSELLPELKKTAVAGSMYQLPFPDNAFDVVISEWSMPYHIYEDDNLNQQEKIRLALEEAVRVANKNGKVIFFPLTSKIEQDEIQKMVALGKISNNSMGRTGILIKL